MARILKTQLSFSDMDVTEKLNEVDELKRMTVVEKPEETKNISIIKKATSKKDDDFDDEDIEDAEDTSTNTIDNYICNIGMSKSDYRQYVNAYKKLNKAEQIELVKKAQNNDREAAETLIATSLYMVIKIAYKYYLGCNKTVDMQDLIQEGCVALIESIKTFDTAKNCKFLTYTTWVIRSSLFKYLGSQSLQYKVSETTYRYILKIFKLQQKYINDGYTSNEAVEMICKELNSDRSTVEKALSVFNNSKNDNELMEETITAEEMSPQKIAEKKWIKQELEDVIMNITPRARQILVFSFGLFDNPEMDTSQISELLDMDQKEILNYRKQGMEEIKILKPDLAEVKYAS